MPYHQVVFGTSNVVGDLTQAIDRAFDSIIEIGNNEENELDMVDNLILNRLLNDDEVALAKDIFLPNPKKNVSYNTSYGIFLGYTLGLEPKAYPIQDFEDIAERKIQLDINNNIDYILQKIKANNMELHSFYFYILPFNDAETEKRQLLKQF